MQSLIRCKFLKSINLIFIEILDYIEPDEQFEKRFRELFCKNIKLESFRIQNINRYLDGQQFHLFNTLSNIHRNLRNHSLLPFSYIQIPLIIPKIINLELAINSDFIPKTIFYEFANYLKETLCLKELSLCINHPPSSDFEYYKSILDSLSRNNSILKLDLNFQELGNYSENLLNLIRNNHKILEFNLSSCSLEIPTDFASALASNKSLRELIILDNRIKCPREVFLLIIQSNSNKIYVDRYYFDVGTEIMEKYPNSKLVIKS